MRIIAIAAIITDIILKEKKCKKEDILVAILVVLTEFYAGFNED